MTFPAVGIDLVHVPGFREQLALPGSTFARVFSPRELRVAETKPDRALHLAGRWAAKEAFIKAWSQSLYGSPPLMGPDDVDFSEVEVIPDRWGRVALRLKGEVARQAGSPLTSINISHDGDYAVAVCSFVAESGVAG